MMNSTAATVEATTMPSPAGDAHKGRAREGKSTKRASPKSKTNGRERYFLASGESGDQLVVGRELASEQEALVAAFQEKATFFVVTEYRVDTQFKGANALLVKETVSRTDR